MWYDDLTCLLEMFKTISFSICIEIPLMKAMKNPDATKYEY